MNSFNPTIESIQNTSTLPINEEHNCTAINETTGAVCGETESLKIINEFQKLYETRIQNVDHELENEFDQVCMKLEISKEWIKNLREQNVMLVRVVEDLEEIACNRVQLLEQKLKQSSMIVSENMSKSNHTEKNIHTLSNRINNLEKDEEYMKQKIEFLQSDIRGLLELIRRAVQENNWNLDDIKFLEIQPSDIPAPVNCTCDQEEISYKKMQSLKLQIERLQEKENKMAGYQKELENKLIDLNTKLQAKEDVIKKYVSQFQNFSDNLKRQAKFEDEIACSSDRQTFDETCAAPSVSVDMKTFQQDTKMLNNPINQQNQIISYLTRVKLLMEQEKDDLLNLKMELEKTIEKLCCGKDEDYECDASNIMHKLTKGIEYINKIYSRKDESVAVIKSLSCVDINGQFKLMDVLRACAIEAQVTMENIKDEMNVIVSTFKFRHQKYVDLNKEVLDVQNQLIRSEEKISETINKLQLQEKERARRNERITSGRMKLKDMKNEINHAQSRFLVHINEIQDNENISGYTEMCICNELLHSVIEEIEGTSNNLQVYQDQCCVSSDLEELRNQFYKVNSSIEKLQEKTDEALSEHNIVETTLLQKEQKLEQLEKEVDRIHSKIQNLLERFLSPNEQVSDGNVIEPQLYTQTLNEILQTKQNLYKLRKEHDELKSKISQKTAYQECNEKTCLWKSRVTDLQDQVKILQHEAKCNVETNNFLRNSIESMEEERRIARVKSENFRRSHSIDNMELKKQIIELENTLKLQKEIEVTLRQQLSDNEIEFKKSKELLNCSHFEHNSEETLIPCGCYQFKHDTMIVPQLFKTLQNTMNSTKCGLQELKAELKKLICEDLSNIGSSARSIMNIIDKLQKYEDELDNCSQEIDKLKNTLYSKDKLLENMDEIIRIQKDSIVMTQAELKELQQKLQKKIDNQDQIISQYEKEKTELTKQNELQVQTIGHLQNAVVEAKKCIDQMGHKTMSDLQEKSEIIHSLTVYIEEAQSQYNECFSEAAKQDTLLDLQRDEIRNLQEKIGSRKIDNCLTIIEYYSILKTIQEQLEGRVNDMQLLKDKIDTLHKSKCYLQTTCINMKKLWQEAEGKLQELKREVLKPEQTVKCTEDKECQCKVEVADKECAIEDTNNFYSPLCGAKDSSYEHELQSEINILMRENEDMKKQLQKYKLDFDIIEKELKIERENDTYTQQILFELQKLRDTGCCLQYENEQLKAELKKQTNKTEDLVEKLQYIKENDVKFGKLLKKLDDKQMQINNLYSQITNNEITIKKQTETIEELKKKLNTKNQQIEGYLSELNETEEEMTILHNQIQSLKNMLNEKSNDMAKLQADNKMLKNDNSILRMENSTFENKSKEDIYQLQVMLNKVQTQLRFTENNYHCVTEDFNKTQEQLIKITKREADLQECLTNMEKEYCLKLSNIEEEKAKLGDCLDKLRDELEEIQRNYSSKSGEHCKLQDICKSYAEQLDILQQQIDKEREKVKKIEESNRCMAQQLQEYREQNCILLQDKALAEQNNCKVISELQETHKCLLELKRECQLKNKSLACISAELTETAISRSELCNQSQYVVSCIRVWMEEQREYMNKLNLSLKSQKQELLQLEFEKKGLLEEGKKLRRINHLLTQKLKKIHRYGSKNVKNVCVECQILPPTVDIHLPMYSKHSSPQKKLSLTKTARRISAGGNAWWYPKMQYLINELRKSKLKYNENCYNGTNTDVGLEESRDCGYQSSTSK
ncbi:uncharacterized protein LOC117608265 isoform X2 [Osmia lignaria lignaria]|uniref:uncharacterized protein LOC117608265 isoform X2 n=1 Tax=Osmia lignaria lignaria TaxID=1437193 RepID=UPI00402B3101